MAQLWSCRFSGSDYRLATGTRVTVETSGMGTKPGVSEITRACAQQLGKSDIPISQWEITPM